MSPTLFLIGADGPLMFAPTSLVDASEKDNFVTTARLACIAHAALVHQLMNQDMNLMSKVVETNMFA